MEICQTQIKLYTRGLKDSGHNQDIKLAAAISSKRIKEGKFLKDTTSIEIRREVRKFSLKTHMYNYPAADPVLSALSWNIITLKKTQVVEIKD